MGILSRLLGLAERNQQKFDEEDARLTKEIERNPSDFHAYGRRADLRFRKQDWQGAVADYTRAIQLNPQDPLLLTPNSRKEDYELAVNSLFNRAEARLRLGDVEGAKADFRDVLRLLPGDTDALQRLKAIDRAERL